MARITFFVAALTGLASAAVTLTRGPAATGPVADASVSSATLFFADGLPVVWWGEASAEPAAAANSLNSVAAYATYDRAAHNSTGFGQLWITTTQKVPSLDAMFAAGYLEGALTYDTMYQFYQNEIYDWFFGEPIPAPLLEFLEENLDWSRRQSRNIDQHATSEARAFWRAIALTVSQLDGLVAGYNAHCPPEHRLSTAELLLLSADGDLETLVPVFSEPPTANRRSGTSRCSALVKFLDDKSDILAGHCTWDHYSLMLRTLKTYNISLECTPQHATDNCEPYERSMTFSSSPGFLWSLDDWYVTSNGLVVMETTNTDFTNMSKDKLVVNSVLSWMRGMAANWLATTPAQWAEYFSMHNSGTYNSQWMVIDYNSFTPGQALPPGSFYVVEQATGFVESVDATQHLNDAGYWGSYNVPYFPRVYNTSGYIEKAKQEGNEFSYTECARAKIFKQQQANITDLESFKRVIRLNDYKNDPLSQGQPGLAIAGRWDLAEGKDKFQLDGAIDAKVTNLALARELKFMAVNGPTHDTQPVFDWSKVKTEERHHGMPDRFDFNWTLFGPEPPRVPVS